MQQLAVLPITDQQVIADFYRAPEFAVVAHDHRPASPVFHPLASYLGAYVDGVLAGLFLLIRFSALEIEVHALILRRFVCHGRDFGRMCLGCIFSTTTAQRVTAYVIEGLESARNYCARLGFTHEGFRRNACSKGGTLLGVHVMGITRQDLEGK